MIAFSHLVVRALAQEKRPARTLFASHMEMLVLVYGSEAGPGRHIVRMTPETLQAMAEVFSAASPQAGLGVAGVGMNEGGIEEQKAGCGRPGL